VGTPRAWPRQQHQIAPRTAEQRMHRMQVSIACVAVHHRSKRQLRRLNVLAIPGSPYVIMNRTAA